MRIPELIYPLDSVEPLEETAVEKSPKDKSALSESKSFMVPELFFKVPGKICFGYIIEFCEQDPHPGLNINNMSFDRISRALGKSANLKTVAANIQLQKIYNFLKIKKEPLKFIQENPYYKGYYLRIFANIFRRNFWPDYILNRIPHLIPNSDNLPFNIQEKDDSSESESNSESSSFSDSASFYSDSDSEATENILNEALEDIQFLFNKIG